MRSYIHWFVSTFYFFNSSVSFWSVLSLDFDQQSDHWEKLKIRTVMYSDYVYVQDDTFYFHAYYEQPELMKSNSESNHHSSPKGLAASVFFLLLQRAVDSVISLVEN